LPRANPNGLAAVSAPGREASMSPGGRPRTGMDRLKAWLVTGPVGRGLAFAIDFAIALRKALFQRR
jgi:hypothetical protein